MTLLVNPSPRRNAAMAELAASNQLILFGGKNSSGFLSNSFNWDGSKWNALNITGPSARAEAAMAYDGTYTTLMGGTGNALTNLSDTWSYSVGTGWFQQPITDSLTTTSTFTIPSLQRASSMAYQSGIGGGEVVLFGGISSYQRHYVQDSWIYTQGNPGTWTLLSPPNSAPGRAYAAMASNATTAVLFGGKNFAGPLSDVWTWGGTSWSLVNTNQTPGSTSPSARYGAQMVFDSSTNLFVLFGGYTGDKWSNETWTFSLGTNTWTNVSPTTSPAGREFHSMAYHSASSRTILFGGVDYGNIYGDTWSFNSTTLLWTQLG